MVPDFDDGLTTVFRSFPMFAGDCQHLPEIVIVGVVVVFYLF
jgi:hypothetical protein